MSTHRAPSTDSAAAALDPRRVESPVGEAGGPAARTVDSATLFRGATELRIDHGGVIYRLKLTALGKLILTK